MRKLIAVLAAGSLLFAACGTEGGDGLQVVAEDFSFDPTTISVDPGQEVDVTLDNQGSAPHTFTSEELRIDIQADGGDSADGSFTAPDGDGTFEFVCTLHPGQMSGEVVVGAGGTTSGTDDDDANELDDVTPGESPPEGTTEGEDENDDGY